MWDQCRFGRAWPFGPTASLLLRPCQRGDLYLSLSFSLLRIFRLPHSIQQAGAWKRRGKKSTEPRYTKTKVKKNTSFPSSRGGLEPLALVALFMCVCVCERVFAGLALCTRAKKEKKTRKRTLPHCKAPHHPLPSEQRERMIEERRKGMIVLRFAAAQQTGECWW